MCTLKLASDTARLNLDRGCTFQEINQQCDCHEKAAQVTLRTRAQRSTVGTSLSEVA